MPFDLEVLLVCEIGQRRIGCQLASLNGDDVAQGCGQKRGEPDGFIDESLAVAEQALEQVILGHGLGKAIES
jgi:hypothetical protein